MVINKPFFMFTGVLFLIIFGPILNLGSFILNIPRYLLLIFLSIPIIIFLIKGNYKINFKQEVLLLVGNGILIIVYSLINFLCFNDPYMLKVSINLILYFLLAIILLKIFNKKLYIFNSIIDMIFIIVFLNSLIIILMGTIEPFQHFIQQFQKQTPLLELAGNYRMMALNGNAGASLSLVTFFGAIAYFYSVKFSKWSSFFMVIVIIGSMLFIGRTGIMFFLIYMFIKYQILIYRKINIIGILISNILLVILSIVFLEWLSYIFYNIPIPLSLWTSIEPIVEIYTLNSGTPRTITFILENFLFLPDTTNGLLFGLIGLEQFDNNVLGYRSDSGYVKMIFSIGMFGLILYIVHYLIILFLSIKYLKYDKRFSYVIIMIVYIFIFHIKELSLGVIGVSFIVYITFFSLLYTIKYDNVKRRNYIEK